MALSGVISIIRKIGRSVGLRVVSAGRMKMTTLDIVESPLAGIICEKEVFNAIFTYSPIGVCLTDMTGKFLDVNEGCAHLFGFSRSEMIGMTFQEITHPEDIVYDTQMMNKVIRGEIEHYEMLKRYTDKRGRIVWATVSMHVVRETGKPAYFIKHIEPQNGKRGRSVPEIRVGDLFRNPSTRRFFWMVISILAYNTVISTVALFHTLGIF